MPDPPPGKRAPRPMPVPALCTESSGATDNAGSGYAELHCYTNYSFLEGGSHADELVQRSVDLGLRGLAVTDRNTLAGVVRAHVAAKGAKLPLLIGAEITPVDFPAVVLLAMDRAGYGRLSRLITLGRRRAEKGACELHWRDVAEHSNGLLALLHLADPGPVGAWSGTEPLSATEPWVRACSEAFGDRAYLLAELRRGAGDTRRLAEWQGLSKKTAVPLVAANGVLYHAPERQPLQDVLTAVRRHSSVAEAAKRGWLQSNAERHIKSSDEMRQLFAACPEAVTRTLEVAGRCRFSLDELRYEYPEELAPAEMSPMEFLSVLTWRGAVARYETGLDSADLNEAYEQLTMPTAESRAAVPESVQRLLDHELRLISELRYEAYFLTVWDAVRFARGRGILCQGRGSAANSAVCYCLGVTSVDPARIDVLFERFISRERGEAPDIDIDFEHERREEVLQYLYEKYGRERCGMTGVVITYQPRSAVREVGKALGLSQDRVDRLSRNLDGRGHSERFDQGCREAGIDPESKLGQLLIELASTVVGFPRHLSQHVGGLVMTRGPLCELVPIENAAMPGRTVIEWDKDDLDALGILKVDCLSLGMLSAIRRAFGMIRMHWGPKLTLANVPAEDPRVYDMACRADTVGVFQIESRAQMSMLPRLKPRCFYDLVIEVAIVRPGPIQGGMVHPFLRRRAGEERVEFPSEAVRGVLRKTLGVPIFQEQVMKLVVVAAGFTPGEADQLRRAMAAWRRKGGIEKFERKLNDGLRANGYSAEFAQRVYEQIKGFGEYGFPESHAASFALLVYVSAWLKRWYPAAFTAALINSQPMGFYAPAQLVRDFREHGGEVRGVDINDSDWDCTLEPISTGSVRPAAKVQTSFDDQVSQAAERSPRALRLGLRLVRGLSAAAAERIVRCRGARRYVSLADVAERTGLGGSVLSLLARADAFRSLGETRRSALWEVLAEERRPSVARAQGGRNKAGAVAAAAKWRQRSLFDGPVLRGAVHGRNPASNQRLASSQTPLRNEGPLRDQQSVTDQNRLPDRHMGNGPGLPVQSPLEQVVADYHTVGLSLRQHPVSFLREKLQQAGVVTAASLRTIKHGDAVQVAGLVLIRQRPGTARGITFVTLEDESGVSNLVVYPDVWEEHRRVAKHAVLMLASGTLERHGEIIHVLVRSLADLSADLTGVAAQSRDFR